MMYDELVNSLRICGKIRSADDYCVAFHDGCCEAEPVCMYELMMKAADAIEELIRKVNRYKNVLTVPEPGQSVYGYPLNELLCFAQMCRRHGIEEKDLHDFCVGVENGFRCGVDDWNRVQNNMIQKMMEKFNTESQKEERA